MSTSDLPAEFVRQLCWRDFYHQLLAGFPELGWKAYRPGVANNNGNWQWVASVGTDPQPVYRRLYNPTRHQERYDADGVYVRRHVPELREVPAEFLAEPWRMPIEVQEAAGCVIGRDYPEPIVDHAQARREALARYRVS